MVADGILDDEVRAAEFLGGVLRGEVQVRRLLLVNVGAAHAEQQVVQADAAVEFGLEHEFPAVLRRQQIGLSPGAGAEERPIC